MILISNVKNPQFKVEAGKLVLSKKLSVPLNTQGNYKSVHQISQLAFEWTKEGLVESDYTSPIDVILVHFVQEKPITNFQSSMLVQQYTFSDDNKEVLFALHINPMTTHIQDINVMYKNEEDTTHMTQGIRFFTYVKGKEVSVNTFITKEKPFTKKECSSFFALVDGNLKIKQNSSIMPSTLIVPPGINEKIVRQAIKRVFPQVMIMNADELLEEAAQTQKHFVMYGYEEHTMMQARALAANQLKNAGRNKEKQSNDEKPGQVVAESNDQMIETVDNKEPVHLNRADTPIDNLVERSVPTESVRAVECDYEEPRNMCACAEPSAE